jgi:hypothetical protein
MLFINFTHYKVLKLLWFPCTLAVAGMWCWETEIVVGYFSKNLNESVLHRCQEPIQFFSISFVLIPCQNSLTISYEFKMSTQFISILQNW